MKQRPARLVGIDGAQDRLASACRPAPTRWRVANDSAGLAACLLQRRQLKPTLIMLEAPGGWQGALAAALAMAKRPLAVVQPRQIRDLAKAPGAVAQTDGREAGVIAPVAEAVRPIPSLLPAETTQQMEARRQRRRPRLELLVAERQRMALAHPTVRESLARHREDLQRLMTETDEAVATISRTSPAWRENEDF
jgi:transposase